MKSTTILAFIKYALAFLFLYTAFSKLMSYDHYMIDLKRSPLLKHYAIIIGILLPATELLVAGLLLLEKTSRSGLFGSLVLMTFFTVYVSYVLIFTTSWPCTCGGIIRELSWPQHLVFNLVFLVLSILGINLQMRYTLKGDAENLKSRP
jgi:putative oxidoreductase